LQTAGWERKFAGVRHRGTTVVLGILLLVLQAVVAWFLTPLVVSLVPLGRVYLVVYAVVAGLLVWLVGLPVGALTKGVPQPGVATLAWSFAVALIGVGIAHLLPYSPAVAGAMRVVPDAAYPTVGALLGYWLRR
jgi:hypothetical protein